MGITGASLYNVFGDKKTLFSRALQYYLNSSTRRRIAELDAVSDAADGLHRFLGDVIEASLRDRRGCLLVNSAMEVAPHDAELGPTIRASLLEIEDGFHRAIKVGQQQGSVSRAYDPRELAKLLLGVVIAIRILARTTADRSLLEGMARPLLGLLTGNSAGYPAGRGRPRRQSWRRHR